MKKLRLYLIIILTIFSCKNEKKVSDAHQNAPQDSIPTKIVEIEPQLSDEEILKQQELEQKTREEIVSKFKVIRNANNFNYHLFCEQERDSIVHFRKIEIYKNKNLVQNLKVDSAYTYYRREIVFEVNEDVNFDGYNDIKLVNWVGMHGRDISFSFYIYNKIQNKYIYFPFLYNINAPEIDKKNKRIIESGSIGPSNEYEHIYKWKNGKLVLVSGYDTNPITGEID